MDLDDALGINPLSHYAWDQNRRYKMHVGGRDWLLFAQQEATRDGYNPLGPGKPHMAIVWAESRDFDVSLRRRGGGDEFIVTTQPPAVEVYRGLSFPDACAAFAHALEGLPGGVRRGP